MPLLNLRVHRGLATATRLQMVVTQTDTPAARDMLILISAGALAALASTRLDFSLKLPGHAILRCVFPMAIGLACVPRHGSGSVMSLSALVTSMGMHFGGLRPEGLGFGAMTSLLATGPILDWTLRNAQCGKRLYLAFALAGLTSNMLAFLVKFVLKFTASQFMGSQKLFPWLAKAGITYPLFGIAAGLISGAVWFYSRQSGSSAAGDEA